MKAFYLILSSLACVVACSFLTSCGGCCTGQEAVPPLRPAPIFNAESAPTPYGQPVNYQK